MAEQDTNGTEMDVSGTWVVPAFTDVSEPGDTSRSYVISNSVTGKYFLANNMSVHLLSALRQPHPDAIYHLGLDGRAKYSLHSDAQID